MPAERKVRDNTTKAPGQVGDHVSPKRAVGKDAMHKEEVGAASYFPVADHTLLQTDLLYPTAFQGSLLS